MESLHLRQCQWIQIQEHLDQCLPFEGCGLLAGLGREVLSVRPVRNHLDSPIRYWMDPSELIETLFDFDDSNMELVGIYHSHPDGSDRPSLLDHEHALDPNLPYLVCFKAGGTWRLKASLLKSYAADVPVSIHWIDA